MRPWGDAQTMVVERPPDVTCIPGAWYLVYLIDIPHAKKTTKKSTVAQVPSIKIYVAYFTLLGQMNGHTITNCLRSASCGDGR